MPSDTPNTTPTSRIRRFREKKTVKKHIVVPQSMSDRLTALAEREGKSESAIIRYAIEKYLHFAGL